MRGFVIYTTSHCGWCTKAKKVLDDNGITYTEVEVTSENSNELAKLVSESRDIKLSDLRLTVPQIFFDGVLLGGYDGLVEWIKEYTEESLEDLVYDCTNGKKGYKGNPLPDMMPIVAPRIPLKEKK